MAAGSQPINVICRIKQMIPAKGRPIVKIATKVIILPVTISFHTSKLINKIYIIEYSQFNQLTKYKNTSCFFLQKLIFYQELDAVY